jgi:hypothetical protein
MEQQVKEAIPKPLFWDASMQSRGEQARAWPENQRHEQASPGRRLSGQNRHTGIHRAKDLAKQKQRVKSTTTIAIKKRTAAIDSGRRIDPGASIPALARPQEEGAHENPRS